MGEWIAGAAAALKIELSVLVSSTVGGFVSLRFFDGTPQDDGTVKPLTLKQRWSIVLAGCAIGTYGTSLVMEILKLQTGTRVDVGIGLFLGVFGMAFASAVVKALQGIDLRGAVESWIKRGS